MAILRQAIMQQFRWRATATRPPIGMPSRREGHNYCPEYRDKPLMRRAMPPDRDQRRIGYLYAMPAIYLSSGHRLYRDVTGALTHLRQGGASSPSRLRLAIYLPSSRARGSGGEGRGEGDNVERLSGRYRRMNISTFTD